MLGERPVLEKSVDSRKNLLFWLIENRWREINHLSFKEKMEIITAGKQSKVAPTEFEVRIGTLLEELCQEEEEMVGWVPSKRNTMLDKMKVDMIAGIKDEDRVLLVPLQVTSSPEHGRTRKRKIRHLYEEAEETIPVIHCKFKKGADVPDAELKRRMIEKIFNFSGIKGSQGNWMLPIA